MENREFPVLGTVFWAVGLGFLVAAGVFALREQMVTAIFFGVLTNNMWVLATSFGFNKLYFTGRSASLAEPEGHVFKQSA